MIPLNLSEIRDHRIQIESMFKKGRVLNQCLNDILTSYHAILRGYENRILEEADQAGEIGSEKPAQPTIGATAP